MARRCGPVATALVILFGLLAGGCAANTEPRDLRSLERAQSPNDALACPPGICAAEADFESPVFTAGTGVVLQALRQAVEGQPRVELIAEVSEPPQLIFVQRSAIFRFPDSVWVQAVTLSAGTSVIVYSRSNYGYGDFGVNRERVGLWLDLLRGALAADLVE